MTYAEMFTEIAQKYGLDWRLLAEQAWTESRLDPLAVGKANDMGLFRNHPQHLGRVGTPYRRGGPL